MQILVAPHHPPGSCGCPQLAWPLPAAALLPLAAALGSLLILLQTWLGKAKIALQRDGAAGAICSCSTASAQSRGIARNLRGCSVHPRPPVTLAARPLRLQRGSDRLWRGLMAARKSPRRAQHPGWGEEEDLAAGSRGISSDLLDLEERGAKFSLLGLRSCGRRPPERMPRVPISSLQRPGAQI